MLHVRNLTAFPVNLEFPTFLNEEEKIIDDSNPGATRMTPQPIERMKAKIEVKRRRTLSRKVETPRINTRF